jgi:hypothetical protein
MRQRAIVPTVSVLIAAVSACSSGMAYRGEPSQSGAMMIVPVRDESSTNRVAHAELISIEETSVDAALRRLRPEWMRVNPSSRQVEGQTTATVFVDDVYTGGLEALRLIPVAAVVDLRYLSPSMASDRFGAGCRCGSGVILVTTRTAR